MTTMMMILDSVIARIGAAQIECFILGAASAMELEQESERRYGPLARVEDPPPGFTFHNRYRDVPFLVSITARPDAVECLYRERDGTLNKALCLSEAQLRDILSEAIEGGAAFR